jgi:hypothetical protein
MSWLYARTLHHLDRWVYRATRGRTTFVSWVTGLPVVLLTTTGAKSGRRHTLPLVAIPTEDRLIVIAPTTDSVATPPGITISRPTRRQPPRSTAWPA